MAQSNSPLSINQIVNHSINHFINQNDKVQIDYPITLASSNQLVQIHMVVFLCTSFLGFLKLENPIKKPLITIMSCDNSRGGLSKL